MQWRWVDYSPNTHFWAAAVPGVILETADALVHSESDTLEIIS